MKPLPLLILFVSEVLSRCTGSDPIVMTTAGPVRGKIVYNELLNLEYYAFHGIHYAESPSGDLRFKPPVPRKPWTNIYNATKEGPVCPQTEKYYSREMMSEDCLSLNINVPIQTNAQLPVVVHVHDGQLESISGNEDVFGTQFFVQRNIIGITFNYRLGPMGFLSLGIEEASGNAAIKDVILALKWIQDNIERFGGDPNKVTLSGNSAGSALSQYLLLTEKSKGLYQSAIQISGSALSYRFFARHPVNSSLALTKALGYETEDKQLALKILKEANVFDIIDAVKIMGNNDTRGGFRPYTPFLPCVEIDYPDAVLTQQPNEIVKNGIPHNVPLLIGINSKEGMKDINTIKQNETLIKILNENFELCIPTDIEYPYGSVESFQLSEKIRNFYFDKQGITLDNLEAYIKLISDTQFYYGIISFIEFHKNYRNSQPLYFYYFDFDGYLNWFKLKNKMNYPGACHSDNVGYLFLTNDTKDRIKDADKDSLNMLEANLDSFSNFIKYGNPTPEANSTVWPEYTNGEPVYMVMDARPHLAEGKPAQERYTFWKQIYDSYHQYVKKGGCLEDKPDP